ncbi:hypothetical protein M427DRAFT_255402 [Gonapodya prolifera JEL478]|uniref:Uncharacterized protein n=1 Tax=Gonapodya prolifera (strain JEL478) TaxID=1344416 RepID=A0A139AMF3_GONPJ|nr:hypothetical protein M427DRAFT_255402 [Gonapodya prolifera JEL478]|eukprot:KXS17625.1 hypothetical protein M427DRAFT_255402 [Gonapodya prolifera JEL478]
MWVGGRKQIRAKFPGTSPSLSTHISFTLTPRDTHNTQRPSFLASKNTHSSSRHSTCTSRVPPISRTGRQRARPGPSLRLQLLPWWVWKQEQKKREPEEELMGRAPNRPRPRSTQRPNRTRSQIRRLNRSDASSVLARAPSSQSHHCQRCSARSAPWRETPPTGPPSPSQRLQSAPPYASSRARLLCLAC